MNLLRVINDSLSCSPLLASYPGLFMGFAHFNFLLQKTITLNRLWLHAYKRVHICVPELMQRVAERLRLSYHTMCLLACILLKGPDLTGRFQDIQRSQELMIKLDTVHELGSVTVIIHSVRAKQASCAAAAHRK